MKKYKEIITTMGELKPGDKVMGSDKRWYDIKILPIHIPEKMYEIEFSNGKIKCSGSHEWTFCKGIVKYTKTTDEIFEKKLYNYRYGKILGPKIINMKEIKPTESRCIEVNTEDHLFEILTDSGNTILTHNCQMRLLCGRVGSVASMMALGNTLGTTIDNKRKGAGIVSPNGGVDHVQYYYEEHKWLEEWYRKRGLNNKGFYELDLIKDEDDLSTLETLEGEEEIESNREEMEIEFCGISGVVDKTEKQTFKEV